jgi:hypothetical protein
MGFGIPGAVGASLASGKRVVLICGEGSLMMNLQELQTVKNLNLPIIFLMLNNSGYLTIKHTHHALYKTNGNATATDASNGVTFPNFEKIACAFDFDYQYVDDEQSFQNLLKKFHDINKIYSKDIAFNQCKGFLNDYFGSKPVDFFTQLESTSQAAKLASEDVGTAALCSHIAAKIYNVPILFDNIQDNESNQTRFYILSKVDNLKLSTKDKTTLAVKLKNDDKPGALLGLLQDFESYGVNLLKIESRPYKDTKDFKFWFFIDIEGNILEERIKKVVLKRVDEIKFLGSYLQTI